MSSHSTPVWARASVAALSLFLLLCFSLLAVSTVRAGAANAVGAPTDSPALTSAGKVIYADLSSQVCPTTAFYFLIGSLARRSDAPVSISVTWANGRSAVLPLLQFDADHGIAHYATTSSVASTVTSASAVIYAGWNGEFFLLAPCSMPAPAVTMTPTPTATRTWTPTSTPMPMTTQMPQQLSANCSNLTSDVPSRIVAPRQAVNFLGTAASGGGSTAIVAYWFNFGDGSGTGRIPVASWAGWEGARHAYAQAGSYQVEFLVEQANGAIQGGVNSRCAFRLDVRAATPRP